MKSAKTVFSFISKKTPLSFCLRAGLLLCCLSVICLTETFENRVTAPLIHLNAKLTNLGLNTLGISSTCHGQYVRTSGPDRFSIKVISECTGIFVMVILLSLTVTFPVQWRSRAIGLLLGALLVFVLNLARLVSLFVIGMKFPEYFNEIHVFFWQGLFIVVVVLFWYIWAQRAQSKLAPAETEPETAS